MKPSPTSDELIYYAYNGWARTQPATITEMHLAFNAGWRAREQVDTVGIEAKAQAQREALANVVRCLQDMPRLGLEGWKRKYPIAAGPGSMVISYLNGLLEAAAINVQ